MFYDQPLEERAACYGRRKVELDWVPARARRPGLRRWARTR